MRSWDAPIRRFSLRIWRRGCRLNDSLVLTQGKTAEFEQHRVYGDRRHTNLISKFPIQDGTGAIIGIGGTITDITEQIKNTLAAAIDRKRAEDRVAYLAQFDALTGLPNRNLYIDRLWQSLRQTDREKRIVGVVFVNVDRFKSVNDKLGHGGGDGVLVQVAARLQECLRPADTRGTLERR